MIIWMEITMKWIKLPFTYILSKGLTDNPFTRTIVSMASGWRHINNIALISAPLLLPSQLHLVCIMEYFISAWKSQASNSILSVEFDYNNCFLETCLIIRCYYSLSIILKERKLPNFYIFLNKFQSVTEGNLT